MDFKFVVVNLDQHSEKLNRDPSNWKPLNKLLLNLNELFEYIWSMLIEMNTVKLDYNELCETNNIYVTTLTVKAHEAD